MTVAVSVAARAAEPWAAEPFRVALDVPHLPNRLAIPRAVYLAYARAGELHYIGKVDRSTNGNAGRRLNEHLSSSRRKRFAWRWLWVVPLSSSMPRSELLALERSLIVMFRPPGNVQHS